MIIGNLYDDFFSFSLKKKNDGGFIFYFLFFLKMHEAW